MRKLLLLLLFVLSFHSPVYGAVSFDGTNDCLNSASSITYGTNIITTSFWAKNTAGSQDIAIEATTNANDNDGAFVMFFDGTATGGSCDGSVIAMNIQDSVSTGKIRQECMNTPPSNDVWHHYSVVWDNSTATGDIKLYVDGSEETLVVGVNTKDQSSNIISSTLYVGQRACSSLPNAFDMDEFYIHSGELSAAEISLLANADVRRIGLQFDNATLLYLPLDECPDGTACTTASMFKDYSGNDEHFSPTNSPTGQAGEVLSYP